MRNILTAVTPIYRSRAEGAQRLGLIEDQQVGLGLDEERFVAAFPQGA